MRLYNIFPIEYFLHKNLELAIYEAWEGMLDELVAEFALIALVSAPETTPLETDTFAYEGAYVGA